MVATARIRGNPVWWIEDEDELGAWYYSDGVEASREMDRVPVVENRACPLCGAVGDGPDPCMGRLPGVEHACCGHGVEPCYVVWEHGVRPDGQRLEAQREGDPRDPRDPNP